MNLLACYFLSASILFLIPSIPLAFSSEIEVWDGNEDIIIEYSLLNASLELIQFPIDKNMIEMWIEPTTAQNGVLSISLPRKIIDAQLGGIEIDFIVQGLKNVGNFEKINFKEVATTETHRILSIDFTADTSVLTIVGTQMAPQIVLNTQLETTPEPKPSLPLSGTTTIKNTNVVIDYSMTHGKIYSIESKDPQLFTFKIGTFSEGEYSDGEIKVTLPDEFKITSNKEQNKIWTIVDGESVDYQFVANPKRSIVIPFSIGAEEIEIYYDLKLNEDDIPKITQPPLEIESESIIPVSEAELITVMPLSPKKQLMLGVDPIDIECKDGLEKIFKHDGSPSCVKARSVEKLIARGWALP